MDQDTRITLNTLLSVLGMLLQFAQRVRPPSNRVAAIEARLDQVEARVDKLEQHQPDHAVHRNKHK